MVTSKVSGNEGQQRVAGSWRVCSSSSGDDGSCQPKCSTNIHLPKLKGKAGMSCQPNWNIQRQRQAKGQLCERLRSSLRTQLLSPHLQALLSLGSILRLYGWREGFNSPGSTPCLIEPSRKRVKGLVPGTHSKSLLCSPGSDLTTWPPLNQPP